MLKDQWVAYLSQPNGATPKPQYYPDEVASSFELAAVGKFILHPFKIVVSH